jgi:8-oxo-dGTP pyrophosphatase MutT (NUDIX family)
MARAHQTTHERSAGAVVFHAGPIGREYLLLGYGAGHWGFPKGHVEAGETDVEAALRETAEETGIPVERQRLVPGFLDRTDYQFRRGRALVTKEVAFFLVEAAVRDVRISAEHTGFAWLSYADALARVSFDGPKRVLAAAESFLGGA